MRASRRLLLALVVFPLLLLRDGPHPARAEEPAKTPAAPTVYGRVEDFFDKLGKWSPKTDPEQTEWYQDVGSLVWEMVKPDEKSWAAFFADPEKMKPEYWEACLKYSYGMNPYDFFLYSTRDYKIELARDAVFIGTKKALGDLFEEGFMARFFKFRVMILLGTMERLLKLKKGEEADLWKVIGEQVKADFREEFKELVKFPKTEEGKEILGHGSVTTTRGLVRSSDRSASMRVGGMWDGSGSVFEVEGRRSSFEQQRVFERVERERRTILKGEDKTEHKEWSGSFLIDKIFIERTVDDIVTELEVLAKGCEELAQRSRVAATRIRAAEQPRADRLAGDIQTVTEQAEGLASGPAGETDSARTGREGRLASAYRRQDSLTRRLAAVQKRLDDLGDVEKATKKYDLFAKQLREWGTIVTDSREHLGQLAHYLSQNKGMLPLDKVPELASTVDKWKNTRTWKKFSDDLLKIKDFPEYEGIFKKLGEMTGLGGSDEGKSDNVIVTTRMREMYRQEFQQRWGRVQMRFGCLKNVNAASMKVDMRLREFVADYEREHTEAVTVGKIPYDNRLKKAFKWVYSWLTAVLKTIDMDSPKLELNPDFSGIQKGEGWYSGGSGVYEGWATISDESSGINPKEVHLFATEVKSKTTEPIKDVKLVLDKADQYHFGATRILEGRIRYRFPVTLDGQYIVWGYIRDRAGHASCDMANPACAIRSDHAYWKAEEMLDADALLAKARWNKEDYYLFALRPYDQANWIGERINKGRKWLSENGSAAGLDPEKFRPYAFHRLDLTIKEDRTPPTFKVLDPNIREPLPKGQAIPVTLKVEDAESKCRKASVAVWLTDLGGVTRNEWKSDALDIAMKDGTKAVDTKREPLQIFSTAEVKVELPAFTSPGLYCLNIQATNRANTTNGEKFLLRVGDAPEPFYIHSRPDPYKALYQQKDKFKVLFTAMNLHDSTFSKVTLEFVRAPSGIVTVGETKPLVVMDVRRGEHEAMGEHEFSIESLPADPQEVEIRYKLTLERGQGNEETREHLVKMNLYDEDAELASSTAERKFFVVTTSLQYEDKTKKGLRPVPRGSMVSVSQIYKYIAMGSPKYVEQYIGYGEVENDDGYVSIRLAPQSAPPYKIRFVVKTQSHMKDLEGNFETVAATLASTVPRPFLLITREITVSEAQTNLFKQQVFSLTEAKFPFHSQYDPERKQGITIPWEGELSTGGYISPYGHDMGTNPFAAVGTITGLGPGHTLDAAITSAHGTEGLPLDMYNGPMTMATGIIRQNHGGALSILGDLIRGYDFSKRVQLLSDDYLPYEVVRQTQIPLVFRRQRTEKVEPGATFEEGGSQFVLKEGFRYKEVERTITESDIGSDEEIIFEAEDPPPFPDAIRKVRIREEQVMKSKEISYPALLVADTGHDRVMEVVTAGGGTNVVGQGDLSRPVSVEKLDDGVYLVCCRASNQVVILENGARAWEFGADDPKTDESEALSSPEYAHATGAGTVLITDGGNRRVIEVERNEKRIVWSHETGLTKPVMATETPVGNVLIVDEGANRVVEIDRDGKEIGAVGGLKAPTSALRLPKGEMVVADSGNNRALLVGEDGGILREVKETWRESNDKDGRPIRLTRPVKELQFAFFADDLIYLVERDTVVTAGKGDREGMVWGKNPEELEAGQEALFTAPECASVVMNSFTYKWKETNVIEDPYWEWARKIKIRRKVKTDILIEELLAKKLEWAPKRKPLELKRIAASWSPYGDVPGSLGYMDTVVGNIRDVPRILVRGGDKNPDEEDPHVVLRAWATFFRTTYLRKSFPDSSYSRLDIRATGIQHAWEQGWDHFLPCAVLDDPRWLDLDFRGKPVADYDLEAKYMEVLEAYEKNPRDLATKFHDVRGLDSGYAWAMLFWQLYKKYDIELVNHVATYAETSRSADPYIDVPTLLGMYPDDTDLFEVLGMIPKLAMEFPNGKPAQLNTAYPKLSWEANDMMVYPEMVKFTLEISEGDPLKVIQRLEAFGDQSYDFGKILKPEEMRQKLGAELQQGRVYYWRVIAHVESGSVDYEITSPWGAFVISLTETKLTSEGGKVSLEEGGTSYGTLEVPKDATDGTIPVAVEAIEVEQGKDPETIVNGKVFNIDTRGIKFKKAATLSFRYDPEDLKGVDPKGIGIYTFDQDVGKWEYVESEVDPAKGEVKADIEHTSLYALMVDRAAPRVTGMADGPDPARTGEAVSLRFVLDEPARATVRVVSDRGARTLVSDEPLPAGEMVCVWDGADDAGARMPEGTYSWSVVAVDRAGHESRTEPCRIVRTDASRGAVTGRVRVPGEMPGRFRAEVLDTSLSTETLATDGTFRIEGTVGGAFDVGLVAEGVLPRRIRAVRVPLEGSLDLGEVELTDRAVTMLGRPPEAFSPDGDGRDDAWTLRYDLSTPCTVDLEIVGEGEASCAPVSGGPQTEGANVLEWKGLGLGSKPLPNGFYTIRVWVRPSDGVEGDRLFQSEHRVLLDNGLLQEAGAFPVVLSPNDDAFDDETSIEAVATHAGVIDAQVLDSEGRLVRVLAAELEVKPERIALPWDGKDDKGEVARDGTYLVVVRPSYPGPVPSRTIELKVLLDRTPPSLGEISPATSEEVPTGTPKLRARVLSDPSDIVTATLKVKVDEVTTDPDSYDPETGWIEFTPKTSLGVGNEGVHVAIFYVQDQAGNYADPAACAFRVKLAAADRTAPRVEVLSPADAETVYGSSYSIVARLTDAESGILPDSIVLCVDGKKVASTVRFIIPGKSGKPWDLWQYEKSLILFNPLTGEMRYNAPEPGPGEPPMDGRHTFTLDVEDRAGRIARSVEGDFVLVPDPYAPRVKSIAPGNGVTVEEPQPRIAVVFEEQGDSGLDWDTLRFFVDGVRIDSSEVRVDDGTGFRWRPSQPLADGADHVVLVDIRDRARNKSETAMSVFTVRGDREPPSIELTSPRPGERRLGGLLDVEATVTDTRRVDASAVRLELDGEALPFEYDAKSGRLHARLEALGAGRHLLVLSATDASGNASPRVEAAFEASRDLMPPVATVEETGAGKLRIRIVDGGSGVDWSSVDLRIDGRPITVAAPASGDELEVLAPEGGVLVLKARDREGNPAEPVVRILR